MKVKRSNLFIFLLPCLLLFGLVFLVPIIMVFTTSFFNWKAGASWEFVGLSNYITAFTNDPNMKRAIYNTLIWVILQSIVHVFIGALLAFILSKKPIGWKLFRTIVMIPNVISMAALGVIFLNVFNSDIGIINSIIGAILGRDINWNWYFSSNTSFLTVTLSWLLYAGLVTIIIMAGIMAVPKENIEAARIDGASKWQVDTLIILPSIKKVLGTTVILSATSMMKEFELIYLTTAGGPGNTTLNLPLYLYRTSLIENNYGYANMMGVTLIIFGVLTVFLINKIFKMDESDV